MKVLILGAGRVGGSLARALVNSNYDVAIVDLNKAVLDFESKKDPQTLLRVRKAVIKLAASVAFP